MRAIARGRTGPAPSFRRSISWLRLASTLSAAIRAGHTRLVLADYEDALTAVAEHPDGARLRREVTADLSVLAASFRVHVGIVSGRPLAELRPRVDLPRVIYAGGHGLEMIGPGITFCHPAADGRHALLAFIAERLRDTTSRVSGAIVELKSLTVSVDYRNVAPVDLPMLHALVERSLSGNGVLCTVRNQKAIDILPTRTWERAQCALWIRDHVHAVAGALRRHNCLLRW